MFQPLLKLSDGATPKGIGDKRGIVEEREKNERVEMGREERQRRRDKTAG